MPYLVILIESNDDSDLTWLKDKCVPAVENVIEESQEEGRLDGLQPEVSWDIVEKLSELEL